MYQFNNIAMKNSIVEWIRDYFKENGDGCNAIVGISGGKDSTVVAALCVEALGKDRVVGVLMPNGEQYDIADSLQVCDFLQIRSVTVNIKDMYDAEIKHLESVLPDVSEQTRINLAPRLRMTTLFAVSQSMNGRVANTCNLSEDWAGYSTLFGDSVGQFSPLSDLTSDEVVAIGEALQLPKNLIYKVPSDGLCGKIDEDNLGFAYSILNKYIRTGICEDQIIKEKIDKLHRDNAFKLSPMPYFSSNLYKHKS